MSLAEDSPTITSKVTVIVASYVWWCTFLHMTLLFVLVKFYTCLFQLSFRFANRKMLLHLNLKAL